MARLKVYEWEQEKFPELFKQQVQAEDRVLLTEIIAHHYSLDIQVRLKTRGGGHYWHHGSWGGTIGLPVWDKQCSLGLILHELAHAYDHKYFNGNGHQKKFKRCMIKMAIEVPPAMETKYMPRVNEIKQERLKEKYKAMKREEAAEAWKRKRKELMGSYSFKRKLLLERIGRLERRGKRITTLLKTARRRLAALDRFHTRREQNKIIDPINNPLYDRSADPIQTTGGV